VTLNNEEMEDSIKASSVESFIQLLQKEYKNFFKNELLWFRGEDSIGYGTALIPKAYRNIQNFEEGIPYKIIDDENNRKADFRRESTTFLINKGIDRTDWNLYFLMQHYGIKTRMLDWTESALLALFFTVTNKPNSDGRVWILAPHNLNQFTSNEVCGVPASSILIPEKVENKSAILVNGKFRLHELTRRYLMNDYTAFEEEKISKEYYPVAILPPLLDERMVSQQSCFTIFGNKIDGLQLAQKKQKDILRSIIIDGDSKKTIKNELKRMGINYKSIYPDLSGLSLAIEDSYD